MKHFFYLALFFISVNISVDAQDLRNICPDRNHPHAIDLGTGVLWACCNVGASDPLDYGDTYEWGTTRVWRNYRTQYIAENVTINNISGSEYDVARMKWGGKWRMPTIDEVENLYDRVTSGRYTWGSDPVLIFKGNGKQIVLPSENEEGNYWSSQRYSSDKEKAFYFGFDIWHNYYHGKKSCNDGCVIRPVRDK